MSTGRNHQLLMRFLCDGCFAAGVKGKHDHTQSTDKSSGLRGASFDMLLFQNIREPSLLS